MKIKIERASLHEKSVLRNLMELCQHDYSEYDGADVNEHGLFEYRYIDHYWTDSGRHPFVVRVSGRLAGFVLVREVEDSNTPVTHAITEFFVLRKFRRQGIGRKVARQIFDMFPGQWSIYQEEENLPAQSFWRKVIAEYTQGAYFDEHLNTEEWHGPCQRFQSRIAFE